MDAILYQDTADTAGDWYIVRYNTKQNSLVLEEKILSMCLGAQQFEYRRVMCITTDVL